MAKKVILIVLGILGLLCGLASICGGGGLLAVGGTSGTIKSGFHPLSTPTVGFVSDPAHIQNTSNVSISGSDVTIKVDGRSQGGPLFIGVGRTTDVTTYLSGSPYELITNVDFEPFKLTTQQVSGTARPAAPGDQAFWVARASGTNPSLSWKLADGQYRVVIMNADGSPNVRLTARIGVKAPFLGGLGIGALIFGVVVFLLGLALLIWGIRTRRRQRFEPTPVYPGYSPPGGGYPGGGYPPAGGGYPPSGGSYPAPGGGYTPPADPYAAPPPPPSAFPPPVSPPENVPPPPPPAFPPPAPPPAEPPPGSPPTSGPPSPGWQPKPHDDPPNPPNAS